MGWGDGAFMGVLAPADREPLGVFPVGGCEIWRIFWGAMRVVRSGGGGEGVAVGGGWHGGMVRAVGRDPAAGMWGGRGGIGEPGVVVAAGSPPRIASPGSSPGQAGAGSPRGWMGRGRPGPEDPSPHSGGDAGSTRRARDRCCLSPRRGEECRNDGRGGADGGGRRGGAGGVGQWAFGWGCGVYSDSVHSEYRCGQVTGSWMWEGGARRGGGTEQLVRPGCQGRLG